MEIIKEYFLCAICAVTLIGYAENLVIDKFRPYVKLITGLFIIILLARPSFEALNSFVEQIGPITKNETSNEQGDGYVGYVRVFKEQLCISVKDYIIEHTGIAGDNIQVDAVIDSSDIESVKISLIKIKLYTDYDVRVISNMIQTAYNAETEIVCINEET